MVARLSESSVARLAMASLQGVGQKTVLRSFLNPLNEQMSAHDLIQASLGRDIEPSALDAALEKAWGIINDSADAGIAVLAYDDEAYPSRLRSIPNPPPFVFVRGRLPQLDLGVAVIGTREPAPAALEVTREVVQALAWESATVVVSGLAVGIDTAAHEAALRCGLRTVAVLANGLDTIYPKSNAALAEEIVESGGALLSEVPTGQRVTNFNLVARDRLQSGLSRATILIQSSLSGGSMHTACFTLEQKRMLVACRPLESTNDWSGNRFLTQPRAEIQWSELSEKLQRFAEFPAQGRSLAFRLSPEKLDDFIRAGLDSRFIPQKRISEDVSHPSLDLGL